MPPESSITGSRYPPLPYTQKDRFSKWPAKPRHTRRVAQSPLEGRIALPQGVEQPAVLDGDLEVALGRQCREQPVGFLHRKRGLKRRPRYAHLPAPSERLQQLFLLGAFRGGRSGGRPPRRVLGSTYYRSWPREHVHHGVGHPLRPRGIRIGVGHLDELRVLDRLGVETFQELFRRH